MPSSEDIELEAGLSSSSLRRRDPEGEDNASRHLPSPVHSGGPARLDAGFSADPSVDDDETDESDESEDEFRPGYEEGLLVILRRFARLVVSKRRQEDFEIGTRIPMKRIRHTVEEQENLSWARNTLSAIKNRDGLLPELPTDISHPLLKRFVIRVNQRRHESICPGSCNDQEGSSVPDASNLSMPVPDLLQPKDPPAWGSSMKRHLFELFHYLSRTEDQQQKLKTIADAVTYVCPLPASLRVTVCDFGNGEYDRFDTTLDAVITSESSERLYFRLHLCMLMVFRNCGKANLGDSPLDVRLSTAQFVQLTCPYSHIPSGRVSVKELVIRHVQRASSIADTDIF